MVGLVMTQVARTSRTTAGVLGLSRRGIAGQAMRDRHEPKPAAFDYERKGFNLFRGLWDKTTSRMDENSKLIMVDGAHGVAQSELCRALAEEFEMLYLPQIRMDDFYINPYGQDYRKLDDLLLPRTRSYDEKDFIRDPLAVPGCYDRQHFKKFEMMVEQSMAAYRHIFNTGQGVIMERGPFSDLIYARAALNAGWLSPSTLDYLRQVRTMWIGHLLRPNLLIWLDSPVSEVQKKMKESGNEWDVNSPVWKNTRYLQDIYEGMKNNYLKEAKSHSQVLVYDWTNPGDTEIVVEDIEDLNFDHYGLHDEQQSDWRWYNETEATALRLKYTSPKSYATIMNGRFSVTCFHAEHMYYTNEEKLNLTSVLPMLKGNGYEYGFNEVCGDSVLFKGLQPRNLFVRQHTNTQAKALYDHRYVE